MSKVNERYDVEDFRNLDKAVIRERETRRVGEGYTAYIMSKMECSKSFEHWFAPKT